MTNARQKALLVFVLGAFGACAAPTLPLPPPEATVGPPNELGIVHVEGSGAEPSSLCFCLNKNTGTGVVTTADGGGSFSCDLAAEVGDFLDVWYEVGFDKSQPLELEVLPPPAE